jgi:hypothetical protein
MRVRVRISEQWLGGCMRAQAEAAVYQPSQSLQPLSDRIVGQADIYHPAICDSKCMRIILAAFTRVS